MGRITFEGNFCDISMCRENPCPYNGMCSQHETWERLKKYEDTGLEPEEIYEVRFLIAAQRDPQKLARLSNLVLAYQEGRLVVLPCKAGDHVWVDGREAVVENFFGYETERYLHAQFYENMQYIDIPFTEIGKTVFLTREEAEHA